MEIRRFFAYAENARALLRETLTAHPETLTQVFETTAQDHTIGQLIAHLVGAERRLTLGRLYGETPPPRYEEQAAETLEGLFADWDAIRTRTAAFVLGADAAALAHIITMVLP